MRTLRLDQIETTDFGQDFIVLRLPGFTLYLYRVKTVGEKLDFRKTLHCLVGQARKSYYIWGDVPLKDKDDDQSVVYLARTSYQVDAHKVSEWVTLRLITATKDYSDDINHMAFYSNKSDSLTPLAEKLHQLKIRASQIGAISRIAKISPPHQQKNQYFAQAFAALRLMAASDCLRYMERISYLVMRLKPSLADLGEIHNRKPIFTLAEDTLGLRDQGRIGIYREDSSAWEYALSYPAYFLEMDQLKEVIQSVLGGKFRYNGLVIGDLNRKNAKAIAPLLKKVGGTRRTKQLAVKVEKLLHLIYEGVEDGINLAMIPVENWRKTSLDMLKLAATTSTKR